MPLQTKVHRDQGVARGPVGVASTGAAAPMRTTTLPMSPVASRTKMPGSPGRSFSNSQDAVPAMSKAVPSTASGAGVSMRIWALR
jgi:hypothetical protein